MPRKKAQPLNVELRQSSRIQTQSKKQEVPIKKGKQDNKKKKNVVVVIQTENETPKRQDGLNLIKSEPIEDKVDDTKTSPK
jgi:hypothetical protein